MARCAALTAATTQVTENTGGGSSNQIAARRSPRPRPQTLPRPDTAGCPTGMSRLRSDRLKHTPMRVFRYWCPQQQNQQGEDAHAHQRPHDHGHDADPPLGLNVRNGAQRNSAVQRERSSTRGRNTAGKLRWFDCRSWSLVADTSQSEIALVEPFGLFEFLRPSRALTKNGPITSRTGIQTKPSFGGWP